eukprot:TRINITY_DN6_c0_g3_i1.p11 TRINITY_DN6_c0_g3~~TRINITY_DN6_c0_g3_i1.p11  ORF type:complete len:300 (+),score=85.31 TRINITY_DN6_c0_g3_i1:259-1158(+)
MLLSSYLYRKQKDERHDEEFGVEGRVKKGGKKKEKRLKLNPEDLFMIVKDELKYLQDAIEAGKTEAGKILDQLQAVIKGTKEIISGIKREAFDFKRDVVVGAENEQTGKVVAEKLIKYRNKKLEEKRALICKLKEKNVNLTKQCCKIKEELAKKTDTGDGLKFIDFHQLEIENQKHMKEIDEENKTLLRLKNESGKINGLLKDIKDKLERKEKELHDKIEDISNKERNIAAAYKEKKAAEEEAKKTTARIRKLERKANRWNTNTQVSPIQNKIIGSDVHTEKERTGQTEKETARPEEKL